MAFSRPTHAELLERIRADIEARTEGSAFLRRSFERVLVFVLAGLAHGLYGYLDWIAKQILPNTCDEAMLLRWGAIFDVTRKQPTKASGNVRFPGVDGSAFPLGTEMQLADGTRYAATSSATVAAGFATVPVRALESGAAGNVSGGASMRLLAPLTGIQSLGEVYGADISGGADIEDIEAYRERVLEEIKIQKQGGTKTDYERWARATPGVNVDRVWVRSGGPAVIEVLFSTTDEDPIPTSPDVAAVQVEIDAHVPVDVIAATAIAPTSQPLSVALTISPDTPEVRAAVVASLVAMVRRDAQLGGPVLISRIREAVSAATGETDHVIAVPAGDVAASSPSHLITLSASNILFP